VKKEEKGTQGKANNTQQVKPSARGNPEAPAAREKSRSIPREEENKRPRGKIRVEQEPEEEKYRQEVVLVTGTYLKDQNPS